MPIRVSTNSKPLAIDINLRPVAKSLSKQKFYVDSHYFVAIDSESQLSKVRVGSKIYAFKGTSQIEHFVNSLAANPPKKSIDSLAKDYEYG